MNLTTADLYDERKMLQLLSEGSEYAFSLIFDRYRQKVYSIAWKFSNTNDMAEEVVQDVFLRVWLKRQEMNEVQNLEAWLFILTRNLLFDRLKSQSYETMARKACANPNISVNDADHVLRHRECQELIMEAVNRLPQRQKEIYQMAKISGLSHESIARELHLSHLTVKKHMAVALKSIRKYLQKYTAR
jgi:RNA polymerase sigma-70 factor (ECF subfamily)